MASWSAGPRLGFTSPEEATSVGETGPRPPRRESHTASRHSPSPKAACKALSAPRSPGPLEAWPEPALGLGPLPLLSRPLAVALVDHLSCWPKPGLLHTGPGASRHPPEHILSQHVTRVSSWLNLGPGTLLCPDAGVCCPCTTRPSGLLCPTPNRLPHTPAAVPSQLPCGLGPDPRQLLGAQVPRRRVLTMLGPHGALSRC